MCFLYLITTVESIGDGINSAIAAVFNSFPNTTFSQNNGVIQMTGVASRYVGYFIAGFLALFGLFPIVGGVFSIIPAAVIGGAMIVMAGTIAAGVGEATGTITVVGWGEVAVEPDTAVVTIGVQLYNDSA